MKKEDKDLLLRDLCARLPYGVIAKVYSYWNEEYFDDKLLGIDLDENDVLAVALPGGRCEIDLVKPYLRPLSSMTEEEKKELSARWLWARCFDNFNLAYLCDSAKDYVACSSGEYFELQDWLNAHHFDYRGLIPNGLALEAPKDMYNEIKEERK